MGRLDGKTAIVTGAGGGIGRAICTRFAVEGAAVVCVDINADTVTETATHIRKTGGLTVLVNNAVHDLPLAPLTEISLADWRRAMDVNLNGAFLMSKHAIPIMAEGGGGSIIHIASQLGYTAKPGRTWYCAQKAALINLARAMAVDHARQKIRVNSLSPGPIETRRFVSNFESLEAARAANDTLLDRLGRPEEIADGTVFLASDESSFMTGADLLIDGGYTAV